MTVERRNWIGYQLFRYKLSKTGIPLNSDSLRDIGNAEKETGIPAAELKQFFREVLEEMIKDVFKETRIKFIDDPTKTKQGGA